MDSVVVIAVLTPKEASSKKYCRLTRIGREDRATGLRRMKDLAAAVEANEPARCRTPSSTTGDEADRRHRK